MIEIRPTSYADIISFYGKPSDKTIKAFTVTKDGEIACIAGVTVEPQPTAFSDVKDVGASKFAIYRTAKLLAAKLMALGIPATATTSNGKFLASLGLSYAGEIEDKHIYLLTGNQ